MKSHAALVVEDDEPVQHLLRVVLRKYCGTVDVASDGEEALQMLGATAYDVVVLDLMLPKVNGLQVAEFIDTLASRPKLIVLSAIARYFTERFRGETVVLQKPFEIDRVEEALRLLAADQSPAAPPLSA